LIYALKLIHTTALLKAKTFSKFNQFSEKNKIVFIGDSLTDFYHTDEFFYNFDTYNRGIASDTTSGVLDRLQDNVINIEPSKIFLQIGTNDFKYKNTSENIVSSIIKILETIKNHLPDVKLYLISLYPINDKVKHYSKVFTGRRKNSEIIKINSLLKTYCEYHEITYIDMYNHLIDENGNLIKEYTVEGLHINFEGYSKITEILLPYVSE